nr:hypothetical protein Itr_chr03CG25740 [Ipomoea trifida]GMC70914.1 hypothetical protein Iba_chr03aCG20250 [Ipomoea batatas]GMC77485.1 hypothetical protein Iba_chr03eCG11170 [Ipomoea batatas]
MGSCIHILRNLGNWKIISKLQTYIVMAASNFSLRFILVAVFVSVIFIWIMAANPSEAARELLKANSTAGMYCPDDCVGCCEPPPPGSCCLKCGC